jgi:uncharacterized membrane protein
MKKIGLYILSVSYVLAGLYHFINPSFYEPFFPPYLIEFGSSLNVLAGLAEMVLGLLLLFETTRKLAAYLLMAMLMAFVPAHVYMIQKAPFYLGSFYVTETIAWIRLLVLHPILIIVAYWLRKI